MPYNTSGTLTTDIRSVSVSTTWDSQTEWEAYQSKSGITISNGVLTLTESQGPASGLLRYTFNDADTSGSTTLDAWNDNDGTINGATTGVAGASVTYPTAEAYDFVSADNDNVNTNVTSLPGSFSLFAWVNPDAFGSNNRRIMAKDESGNPGTFILWGRGDGSVEFAVYDTGAGSFVRAMDAGGLTTGTWTSICGVYDDSAGTVELYLNGSSVGTGNSIGTRNTTSLPIVIANGSDLNTDPYAGQIDDVRIYTKALSSTEVSNLHSNGSIA